MLTDVAGIEIGHWTDPVALTGCTVIVLPEGTVASGEVRGGAPATREFALLEPTRTVATVDAVVLSGGSAFGLAAGDGVMGWLAERDRGFVTSAGRVPIVVGLSLFDLAVGDGSVRPGTAEGRLAAESARAESPALGPVGAGTGCTVAKWFHPDAPPPGGLGGATLRAGDVVVSALIAVNAVGAIDDGTSIADPGPPPAPPTPDGEEGEPTGDDRGNTTIGVVATNAVIDKVGCRLVAESAHDGLARSLLPAHTAFDGDAVVACATGEVEADLRHVRVLAQQAVAAAVRSLG
ncbi:MAG: P1 family peptidase [Actinomycetota bacterium]